ncbi:Alpha-1,3-mannosyltransferase-like protein [Spiromyces aspiralis]|uniref:Alpha-1,3-mannosyltransferase-like protein n=1 Tax=Spiromyces aspiralis TaxID=68401 RepID=A0ACC1HZ81_9FUNG|nr:Alpha-1,3-mannosyltransferase-like protein [Spiromyces aspiralis]
MHHDPSHCFEETRDGTLKVCVEGNTVVPRSINGRLHILCTSLRSLHLAVKLLLSGQKYDIIIVDQLSVPIPLLKLSGARIFFYCHFPDKLQARHDTLLTRLYRAPFDWIEEVTTKEADTIAVNSRFTRSVFARAFRRITKQPKVLYPSLNLAAYDRSLDTADLNLAPLRSSRGLVVSINRFERKKDLALAIRAFHRLITTHTEYAGSLRLVMAGGYDPRVEENVQHLGELVALASKLDLVVQVVSPPTASLGFAVHEHHESRAPSPEDVQIVFLPSFSENQRTFLLTTAKCLIYTPTNEHLGIVPLEAMYNRTPVIAIGSGGPKETVVDGITGFLVKVDGDGGTKPPPPQDQIADYMHLILSGREMAKLMGEEGRKRVKEMFNLSTFGDNLESMLCEMLLYDRTPSTILPLALGTTVLILALTTRLLYLYALG